MKRAEVKVHFGNWNSVVIHGPRIKTDKRSSSEG